MKRICILAIFLLAVFSGLLFARELKPRIVFEKHLWAEGVNPKARYLDALMVKFFDEDMIRLRDGKLISTNGSRTPAYVTDFLARHPEISVEVIIRSMSEEEYQKIVRRGEERSGWDLVDLFSFYRFRLPEPADDPKALLADILKAPEVETAYYEPIPIDFLCQDLGNPTPDYRPDQTYHDPAPLGTDLDYAISEFGANVVDGSSGTWIGIFERGMQTTHEDFSNANVRTSGTPDTDNNHGTAVTGIYGGCDDNNVGVLGYLADETLQLYQRNSSAYGSTADVYTFAIGTGELIAGDLTNSSWGHFSDPMPPGQTCPCNPGQNGLVPLEYDAAVKSAVQSGVALGIHYFVAAGNGCVDLDDATFGNTFRWSTDTGSIYVGAVKSTLPHDSSCYTNWGERVTLCGWGDGIYTTGYNTVPFVPSSRDEWYDNDFGGTSGAAPIVGGSGGVIRNVYSHVTDGSDITTSNMREWLRINGTEAGTFPGYPDPVMPNLFGIMAPNLRPWDVNGLWTYPVVPRNTADAVWNNVELPAALDNDSTFWNANIQNTSYFSETNPAYFYLYFDDVYRVSASAGLRNSWAWLGNYYLSIRGGRHTIRNSTDALDAWTESDETDNDYVHQFVWHPHELTSDVPETYSSPPLKMVTGQPTSYYNCDGYAGNTFIGFWEVMAVQSAPGAADYDARIYSEAVSSENGFDTYRAWSARAGGGIDFVGINNNVQSGHLLASVVNWDNEDDDYIVEGQGSTMLSPTPDYGRNYYETGALSADELFDVWEFYINEIVPYSIEVEMNSGSADIVISVINSQSAYFTRSSALATGNAGGAGESELLSFTPDTTGWHCIILHKNDNNDWQQTANYDLYVGKSVCDLTHSLLPGWSHEIVVRQATGGDPAVLPATLVGNITSNYFNAGYINQGPVSSPSGAVRDSFYWDGPAICASGYWGAVLSGATTYWLNVSASFLDGGRHQIGDMIDAGLAVAEWREDNNRHDEQFVFTPYEMINEASYGRGAAPNWRDFNSSIPPTYYNVDGWRFTGTYWSAVGMCPEDPADEYNCLLYEPATSSTDGFGAYLVPSWSASGGLIQFVVENGNVNGFGAVFDVGVHNNWAWPGTPSVGTYRMHQSNSLESLVPGYAYGPYIIYAYQLVKAFDLYLEANVPTDIALLNLGSGDLGFAIFPPNLAYGSRTSGGTVINNTGDGGDELTEYTSDTTGYHGLVVFKNDYTDLPETSYQIVIGDRVPAAPTGFVMWLIDETASPIEMGSRWDPVTEDMNGAPLEVEEYQIWWAYASNDPWPSDWHYWMSTPLTESIIYVSTSVEFLAFLIVAVDSDGLIVAHTPLQGAVDLRGTPSPRQHERIYQPETPCGVIPMMSRR